jgi:hypothetical protein
LTGSGTEGCTADAQVVTQIYTATDKTPDIKIWEPSSRVTAVVWEYHSNACDSAWYEVAGRVNADDGDLADLSAWNPGGPSQHFTYSVGTKGAVTATPSAMVDDENGVEACVGAQVYYLKAVTVNGKTKLVKTYFQWEVMRCR